MTDDRREYALFNRGATLMTGYFPAQHGVKWTLEQNMPDDQYPQQEMPRKFLNLATVMSSGSANATAPSSVDIKSSSRRHPVPRWTTRFAPG